MTLPFRCQIVLMALQQHVDYAAVSGSWSAPAFVGFIPLYGYGQHVHDPRAFRMRLVRVQEGWR